MTEKIMSEKRFFENCFPRSHRRRMLRSGSSRISLMLRETAVSIMAFFIR